MKLIRNGLLGIWLLALLTTCTYAQSFTDLVVNSSTCDTNGMVMLDIDLYATNLPSQANVLILAGLDDVDGYTNVTYTGTPTRVSLPHPGSGSAWVRAYDDDNRFSASITTNVAIPLCSQACAITDINLLGFEPCGAYGFSEAIFEVHTQNAPTNTFWLNAYGSAVQFGRFTNAPFTTSPTTVRVPVLGNGAALETLIAGFSDLNCYTFKEIGAPPVLAA